MNLPNRQRGLGMWGWIFVLGVIGFVSLVALNLTPVYLAELSIQRVVKAAANDPGNAKASLAEVRKSMQKRWDVEGITTLQVKDVKLVKYASGRALAYDYEARAPLFANLEIVASFSNKFPMTSGGAVE